MINIRYYLGSIVSYGLSWWILTYYICRCLHLHVVCITHSFFSILKGNNYKEKSIFFSYKNKAQDLISMRYFYRWSELKRLWEKWRTCSLGVFEKERNEGTGWQVHRRRKVWYTPTEPNSQYKRFKLWITVGGRQGHCLGCHVAQSIEHWSSHWNFRHSGLQQWMLQYFKLFSGKQRRIEHSKRHGYQKWKSNTEQQHKMRIVHVHLQWNLVSGSDPGSVRFRFRFSPDHSSDHWLELNFQLHYFSK